MANLEDNTVAPTFASYIAGAKLDPAPLATDEDKELVVAPDQQLNELLSQLEIATKQGDSQKVKEVSRLIDEHELDGEQLSRYKTLLRSAISSVNQTVAQVPQLLGEKPAAPEDKRSTRSQTIRGYAILGALGVIALPALFIMLSLYLDNRNLREEVNKDQQIEMANKDAKLKYYQDFHSKVRNEQQYLCQLSDQYAITNCDLLNRLLDH